MHRLAIFGSGGFGREVVTAARQSNREIVFLSDTPAAVFAGVRTIGLSDLTEHDEVAGAVVVGNPARALERRLAA